MRRVIEELVEKRKSKQDQLKKTLFELGNLIENRSILKKKKGEIGKKLQELNENFNQLITIQDKEWDAYSNNHSTMIFKSLQWKIEKLEAEYSNVKTLLTNFINLEKSLENIIKSLEEKTDKESIKQLEKMKKQLSPYQYSDFEQRFRGDEETVKNNLKTYIPIFENTDHILDIGCGRGEFVEMLLQNGKNAMGIDISESMLRIAEQKGLTNCQNIDALLYLKQKQDLSLGGIFSSQVIEHFLPDYLREVVTESFRVLKINSPIVLETINPLSVFALSHIYFLDVTHQNPLHPEYMRHLLESSGFSEVKIIYSKDLKEEKLEEIGPENKTAREFNTNVDKLNKILFSSPVYAVSGVKR